jgi:2,4-dienoyl-CoA reductase-like NADH-dependent reductase (Old Yellow Enzyme family)
MSLRLRGVELRNRIGLAPMSLYRAIDGMPNDWHFVHYGARSHGTGLVMVEATAISPDGRVTPHDLGLWHENFLPAYRRLTSFIEDQGAVPGIQLCHGGRKGSRSRPWDGDIWIPEELGGWQVYGPSSLRFAPGYPHPQPLTHDGIESIKSQFVTSAHLAKLAGFKVLELHAAHGRLLHSFYSPIANQRTDRYGGSFENRIRLLIEVVQDVRTVWPEEYPLVVRLSCVDWVEGGWSLDDSVRLALVLRNLGVDVIDCSSGGIIRPLQKVTAPGYQVSFAREIRNHAGIKTAAVGLIQAIALLQHVVSSESADMVFLGRKMLINPQFALEALAVDSGVSDFIPQSYQRAYASLKTSPNEFIPEL